MYVHADGHYSAIAITRWVKPYGACRNRELPTPTKNINVILANAGIQFR
jgi:hypothetical protein